MRKLRKFRNRRWVGFLASLMLLLVLGCTGGTDSPQGADQNIPGSMAGRGTVALVITDGPSDDFEKLWIWIKTVSLIPADGDEGPVVIFESQDPEGYKVDLLDLRDQEFILTVNDNVPAGKYAKIRLEVLDVQPEGNNSECAELEVKLPSGKLDLTPKEIFEVAPGGRLIVRLDVDVDKSTHLKIAGKSGKCIFRPVIFVDIDTDLGAPQRCPKVLSGTFVEYIYEDVDDGEDEDGDDDDGDTAAIIGFVLDLGNGRETIKVMFTDGMTIFDKNGDVTGIDSLPDADALHVRGKLNSKGCFKASEIVMGGVEEFKGVVTASTTEYIMLTLSNDAGEIEVTLSTDTVILNGCDEPFEGGVIPLGMFARVYGKFDSSDEAANVFRALLIMLKPQPITSMLTQIEATEGGFNLTISNNGGPEFTVFLPDDAEVRLKGDGFIDMDELMAWVDCSQRAVELVFDTEVADPLTAETLLLVSDVFSGAFDEQKIFVQPGATIFAITNGQQALVELDEVQADDQVIAYGVEACEGNEGVDFFAFVLLVIRGG